MQRKHSVLIAIVLLTTVATLGLNSVAIAATSPIERLVAMEQILFGSPQEGAVVNRLEIVERLVFGQPGTGTLPDRLEACWNYVQGDRAGGMNLKFKLRTVQWTVFGTVTDGPIVPVLNDVEQQILGQTGSGSIGVRLDNLLKLTIPGGRPDVGYALVPKGSLVKLRLATELSSSKSRPGDEIRFTVVDDIISEGRLVLPKGTTVIARVLDNVRPTKMGVKARVDLEVGTIEGMDSSPITVSVDQAAAAANTAATVAAGEGLRRFAVMGKEGALGGLLGQNPELELGAGVELFLSVMQTSKVLGLGVSGSK